MIIDYIFCSPHSFSWSHLLFLANNACAAAVNSSLFFSRCLIANYYIHLTNAVPTRSLWNITSFSLSSLIHIIVNSTSIRSFLCRRGIYSMISCGEFVTLYYISRILLFYLLFSSHVCEQQKLWFSLQCLKQKGFSTNRKSKWYY